MAAWISVILILVAFQGIYTSGIYLLDLKGGDGPTIWLLTCMTIVANAVGGIAYCVRRGEKSPTPTEEIEHVAMQTIAEEGFRFIVFAVVFSVLTWFSALLGYSISFFLHPWLDCLGWPGMWAAALSSLAFTAAHVRKDDSMSGFMPIVPSAIFTLALVNYGPIVSTFLHLLYNAEGMAWVALGRRCHRT